MKKKYLPDQVICIDCGHQGSAKQKPRSIFRKAGSCVACGGRLQPLSERANLPQPEQLIQPMDPYVSKTLQHLRGLRHPTVDARARQLLAALSAAPSEQESHGHANSTPTDSS